MATDMSSDTNWVLIYIGIAAAICVVFFVLLLLSVNSLRKRDGDVTYIERYLEGRYPDISNIKRVSSFRRLLLGAIFETSNLARLYKVTFDANGSRSGELFFSFDDVTGKIKVRRGSRWYGV
jgi:hypothetical protein